MAAARKRPGPAGLTAANRKKLLDAVRLGLNLDDAAKLAGVPRATFFDWLERGRNTDADKVYATFARDVDVAVTEWEQTALARISDAGAKGEWQADAWRLERKLPDRYGRRTRIDGQVNVTATPMIDASKLTTDELETLVALLRKASPAQEQLSAEQRPALELVAGTGDLG